MAFLFSALFLAAQATPAGSSIDSTERVSPEIAAARAATCGLGQPVVRYDPELQSHILALDTPETVSSAQLSCLVDTAGPYPVELPPDIQAQYERHRSMLLRVRGLRRARAWLMERNLFERALSLRDQTDAAEQAKAIESLCGPLAKGALASSYGPQTLAPEWAARLADYPDAEANETLACLFNVAAVVGLNLGFVGNEAAP